MPLKLEPLEDPALNLTPMIDVVLTLVIFFMVGTQFSKQESQYDIELPKVSAAMPLTQLPDEIIINIAEDGSISMFGQPRTLEQVESDLRAAHERYADQVVVIRGAAAGPYQNVMSVLDVCKRALISNIQLANRIEAEGAK
ncbi:ExbD/TolR family protein [Planctomicrobium sp. SH664]|uniref:ExbD/TolR family protein n=1 Tax=Planctomicrobium sp. SH664 TaxID=3448125 RepID=UPI003F5C3932